MKPAPGQWIILEIAEGDFQQGFQVKLRLRRSGQPDSLLATGRLPAAPDLPQLYETWQQHYWRLGGNTLIVLPPSQVTNVSSWGDCDSAAQTLQVGLNAWLRSESMRQLEQKLLLNVRPTEGLRVMIQTTHWQLRRLPWHLWDLLENHYPQAEVVLSSEFEAVSGPLRGPVKILAIEGNTSGTSATLPVEAIRRQLPTAKIKSLVQPTAQALQDELWNHQWDILCFVGHSDSHSEDESGVIQLNDTETLSLSQIHEALQYSVQKGLKLALFCSCRGLGLARKLADLKIPYVVVMREPVPDRVAQAFLQHFLTAFSKGDSIHDAVHQARQRLQALRHQFPCAAWLPVICQNPAAPDLRYPKPPRPWFQAAAMGAASLTAAWFGSAWLNSELDFQSRLSLGHKLLVQTVQTDAKRSGVQTFQEGDFAKAAKYFEQSLQQQPNDPESQIYLNNSRAFGRNPIKVAVSVPIGTNPNVAQELLRGVAQQQTELNNTGGVYGRPVQVLIANDDNKKGQIVEGIAQRLVSDRTILAVIGHNASEASVAAAPIYEQGKLVMITPTSYAAKLSSSGIYIFRMVPGIPKIAEMLVNRIVATKPNAQIAICSDSRTPDGGTYQDSFDQYLAHLEKTQHANIHRIWIACDFSKQNFNAGAMVKQLQDQHVNTLLFVPQIDHIDQAIDFMRATQGKFTLFGSPTFVTDKTAELGQETTNGMETAVPWHPISAPDQTFPRQAQLRWGVASNWRTAMAYDALKAISVGLQKSINTDPLQKSPTRESLQAVLRDQTFATTGASGEIRFLPSGDRLVENMGTVLQMQRVSSAKYGFDFVPQPAIAGSPPIAAPLAAPPAEVPKTGSSAAPLAAPSPVRK